MKVEIGQKFKDVLYNGIIQVLDIRGEIVSYLASYPGLIPNEYQAAIKDIENCCITKRLVEYLPN